MSKHLTLGSLFDGSGGFPLAAFLCGITPLWASEMEPFPIRVTQKNLPKVKHLGDIRSIKGDEIPPVDMITFGSPCQDLSIAGKREGLEGSRSNLFYEAIRIIKEMRYKTNGKKPRYILWENVLGAFSSHGGEDFRSVLEQIGSVKTENLSIPRPKKWKKTGEVLGGDHSICWRVLDAKYFGVPQRRRRIFLIADFNGGRSREILFESKSLSRYSASCEEKGEADTSAVKTCSRETICVNDQGGERMDFYEEESGTLKAKGGHPPHVFENHGQDARYKGPIDESPTLLSNLGRGGNNQPLVTYDIRQTSENTKNERHNIYECKTSRTIDTSGNTPTRNQGGLAIVEDIYNMSKNSHFTRAEKNVTSPLVATDYKDPPLIYKKYVRRLTPKECGRLQGFPDDWCEDLEIEQPTQNDLVFWRKVFDEDAEIKGLKKRKTDHQIIKWLQSPQTDSAEYKMWGNGIALPCVLYIFKRLVTIANRT